MAAYPVPSAPTADDARPRGQGSAADTSAGRSDHELLAMARAGGQRAADELIARYRPFAGFKARNYFIPGAEHEDLLQESMVGLFIAIRYFDPSKGASFMAFADICVERQIHTAIKKANRYGQRLFERAARLDADPFHGDGPDRPVPRALWTDASVDPLSLAEAADEIERARAYLAQALTDFEAEALKMHFQGMTYGDIATRLEVSTKGIDNALQRVRSKVSSFLDSESHYEDTMGASVAS